MEAASTRKRGRPWLVLGLALVVFFAFTSWNRGGPDTLGLSILKGVPIQEYRSYDGSHFSQTIYYIETDYDGAMATIERELPGWMGPNGESMKLKGWHEEPGPFQSHGRQVNIRPNKCDPRTFEVYGTAADSKRWVTVCVVGGLQDRNLAAGLWRAITGNKRP